MIEILATGPMSTVQDLGRHGYRRIGVGVAGPLDLLAAQVGNAMLGNDAGCAFIEVALFPFRVRFTDECRIALSGADARATIDGAPVLPWWSLVVHAGQVLSLEASRQGAVAYLCAGGGIDVPEVLGSRSTDLKAGFGGLQGRTLRKGDTLACLPDPCAGNGRRSRGFGVRPPSATDAQTAIRVLPAAEWEHFTDEAHQLLVASDWRISPNSNRIGMRLEGPVLAVRRKLELLSHGIVPGVMQVPPSGLPIVMQCDAQTSGGYPKIATVIEADQWRVAQTPLGGRLRFEVVTPEQAQTAWDSQCRYVEAIRQAVALAQ